MESINEITDSSIVEVSNKGKLIELLKITPNSLIILDYTGMDFNSVDELLAVHERYPQAQWLLFSEVLSE